MPQEPSHDFSQPWCLAIARDPAWKLIPTSSRATHPASTENSLVAETLRTARAVRAVQTYVKQSPGGAAPPERTEVRMMFSLGEGVNGIAGTCHGGLIGLMLDEVTGQLAAEMFGRYHIITAEMKVAYKRKLLTPATVLCRAGLAEEVKGRKAVVDGTIEDGMGKVYATGQTVFVKLNSKL